MVRPLKGLKKRFDLVDSEAYKRSEEHNFKMSLFKRTAIFIARGVKSNDANRIYYMHIDVQAATMFM